MFKYLVFLVPMQQLILREIVIAITHFARTRNLRSFALYNGVHQNRVHEGKSELYYYG